MNQVVMAGRLASAPKRFRNENSQLCTFRIAVKGNYKTGAEAKTDFFPIITWGGLAEACNNHLSMGREVTVNGRLRNRSFTHEGKKYWVTEIIAEKVEFMGSRRTDTQKPALESETIQEHIPLTQENDLYDRMAVTMG